MRSPGRGIREDKAVTRTLLAVAFFAIPFGSRLSAAEPWADPKLTVKDGLELWLDAAAMFPPANSPQDKPTDVETWFDASGKGRHLKQAVASARPKLVRLGQSALMRFDGEDDFLRLTGQKGE